MTGLVWIAVFYFLLPYGSPLSITKRRLDNFARMINSKTKKLEASAFNNYGGWCGFGGNGEPKDDIDRCCLHHDNCYHKIGLTTCKTVTKVRVYVHAYNWTNVKGDIVCHDDEGRYPCKSNLCGCDRNAANCFAQHEHKYNPAFKMNDTFTSIIDYIIRAYTSGKWMPDSTWENMNDVWAKLETRSWELVQKVISNSTWNKLKNILPWRFIPERIKQIWAKQKQAAMGRGEVEAGDGESLISIGMKGTPKKESGEKRKSF